MRSVVIFGIERFPAGAKRRGLKVKASEPSFNMGIIETVLKVAEERRIILEQLREALLSNDIEALKRLASRLCGLEDD